MAMLAGAFAFRRLSRFGLPARAWRLVLLRPGLEQLDGPAQDAGRTAEFPRTAWQIVARPPFMEAASPFDSFHHGAELAISLLDVTLPDQRLDHATAKPAPVTAVLVAERI
jgi:hypothetical protein